MHCEDAIFQMQTVERIAVYEGKAFVYVQGMLVPIIVSEGCEILFEKDHTKYVTVNGNEITVAVEGKRFYND